MSFVEARDSRDSSRIGLNSAESDTENALLTKVKDLTSLNKKKKKKHKPEVNSSNSDKFAVFDWEGSSESITTSDVNCNVALTSETQLDPVRKTGFFSWKRSRLSLRASKGRVEPLTSDPLRVCHFLFYYFFFTLTIKSVKFNMNYKIDYFYFTTCSNN